jgi:hypothetical protein
MCKGREQPGNKTASSGKSGMRVGFITAEPL